MIEWSWEVSISDVFVVVSLIIAEVGLGLNYIQMKRNNKQKRAELLTDLYTQFSSDENMMDIMNKLESGEFKYDEEFHKSRDKDNLIRVLELFDHISKLYLMKVLKAEDLEILVYPFLILYKNEDVQRYIDDAERHLKEEGVNIEPLSNFIEVGRIMKRGMF